MYIAETWKSAQDVIQNDDKEGGADFSEGIKYSNTFLSNE
jgi:hypothetical protein